jgi:hypothetical protein
VAEVSPYSQLPAVGPYEVAIGSALITMVEPHVGHDEAYNRWYEDDHFYAGVMAMPWAFAGRRWVATRDLQKLRIPKESAIANPIELGKYIGTYWLTAGRYDDHLRWTVATNQRLLPDGRIYLERDHVFTAFQQYLGAFYRDDAGPQDIHAMDYPYGGLVVEVIDAAEGKDTGQVLDFVRAERAPLAFRSGVAMGVAFTPYPLPEDRMSYVKQVEGLGRRVTVLWLTDEDPRASWDAAFAGAVGQAEQAGVGRTELVAPFIPTLPGTNRYVDELR